MTVVDVRLKQLRRVNGWSQSELSRRSGVSQAVISRLESGTTKSVNFKNLEKLAGAMGCDPGYLIVAKPLPLGNRAKSKRALIDR
jgi:repressor LexA